MFAIQVRGNYTGLTFILDSRHATREAAQRQIEKIELMNSPAYTTREVVEAPKK